VARILLLDLARTTKKLGTRRQDMYSILYIIGAIVVIVVVLRLIGLV
jgi:uncharacterized membrane protein YkgB